MLTEDALIYGALLSADVTELLFYYILSDAIKEPG
jgi:hypothetical protein